MLIAEALDESAGSVTAVNVPFAETYTGLIAEPRVALPPFVSVLSIVNVDLGITCQVPYVQTPASLPVLQN